MTQPFAHEFPTSTPYVRFERTPRDLLIEEIHETAAVAGDPCDRKDAGAFIDFLRVITDYCRATGHVFNLKYEAIWRFGRLIEAVFPTQPNAVPTPAGIMLNREFFADEPMAFQFTPMSRETTMQCEIWLPVAFDN